jgi:hypothetical protein
LEGGFVLEARSLELPHRAPVKNTTPNLRFHLAMASEIGEDKNATGIFEDES